MILDFRGGSVWKGYWENVTSYLFAFSVCTTEVLTNWLEYLIWSRSKIYKLRKSNSVYLSLDMLTIQLEYLCFVFTVYW